MAESNSKYKDILTPEAVSRLSNLSLIARLVVEGFITGLHKSPYHGFSVEFAEHRPYMAGDDTRHIDWKVFAKTDRYYVKQFEEETNLKGMILLDVSASMDFSSHSVTKFQYSRYLAAALSYLMIKQRDAVGMVTFDSRIRKYLPPRSVPSFLNLLLQEMTDVVPGQETNIAETLHSLADRIRRRGLIMLFSDLLDEPDRVLSGLKHFRHNKHEVIVFHILDPLERSFEFKQDGVFRDMETGEMMPTQPWHIQQEYRKKVDQFIEYFKKKCLANRIDYVLMDTKQPFDHALLQYFIKRKRMGG